jgi:GTP-binding protein LepA
LAEVITDFFDQLKSRTKGYASMSFQDIGYRADNLVRMDIKINGEDAPPLTTIVHRDVAHEKGKIVCNKLKELIPRQQFRVSYYALSCLLASLNHSLFLPCFSTRFLFKRALA